MLTLANLSSKLSRITLTALVAICTSLPTTTAALENLEWTLDKEEDRVAIYTSKVEGSPFLAVKVTATIRALFEKVLTVMGDGNGCSEWRAMCKSSEVIKTVSDNEYYIYMVLNLPWPISDRDLVIHSIAQPDREANTVTVNLNTSSGSHPDQGYVRAESNGYYTLTAAGDDLVEFTWVMHTDLGGKLSPGVINPQLVSSTLKDVESLMKLSES